MECQECQANLAALIHAELDKKQIKQIHRHLGRCDTCAQEHYELLKTKRLLNRFVANGLPPNFDEQLRQKLKTAPLLRKTGQVGIKKLIYAVAATVIITLGLEFMVTEMFHSKSIAENLGQLSSAPALFQSIQNTEKGEVTFKGHLLKRLAASRDKILSKQNSPQIFKH
ncbi:hypothetical protein JXJ21_08810 [candidate division KSB1 bacterium]|nr:hypothetical protein [candidate division KSB1 bacterium]